MSEQNVIEVIVVPEVPKVVSDEEIYVYVPVATNATKGIASFDANSINVVAGVASVNDKYVNDLIDVKVQPLDSRKLDKLTTAGEHVYSHTGDVQEEIAVSTNATPGNIVKRLEDGGILVPDDSGNEHSAVNLLKVNRIVTPISQTLQKRTEVYLTKDEHGYVYINEVGGND